MYRTCVIQSITSLAGMPYVRAHGLYTGMAYAPSKLQNVLVWRAPLFSSFVRLIEMHLLVGISTRSHTARRPVAISLLVLAVGSLYSADTL